MQSRKSLSFPGWVLLGSLLGSASAVAEPTYLPVFHEPSLVLLARSSHAAIPALVRVRVFPHVGRYVTPHGEDRKTRELRIRSAGPCERITVASTTPEPMVDESLVVGGFVNFRLRCQSPIWVEREAGLKSYAYEGEIDVVTARDATGASFIQAVNRVSMEAYLRGVVPTEMDVNWGVEALKVQAVAARTYALGYLPPGVPGEALGDFDIDDTVRFQAYQGLRRVDPRSDRAVLETQGEILRFGSGLVAAFFSDDAGGVTESSASYFGTPLTYCAARREPFLDSESPMSEWSVQITWDVLTNRLKVAGKISADDRVIDASVSQSATTDGGRPLEIRYQTAQGIVFRESVATFVTTHRLKSRFFSVNPSTTDLQVQGRGWGHGVGMSQTGAWILTGPLYQWDYRRVLDFYYPGSRLVVE